MFIPATFHPLHDGWRLTAVSGPVPANTQAALRDGIPATVPGEAHLDLLAAGLITDPFDGDAEAAQQWIGDTEWRWSTQFDWPAAGAGDADGADRTDLVAYGLDTVATVELNGHLVGATANMHRQFRWDVRPYLRPGKNTLTVTFAAPVPETLARAERDGYLPQVNHHEYNQIRKMACSFGWDWGIDVAGAGIWQPIGLDSWSGVRIAAVRPLVDVVEEADELVGVLTAHVDIERATRKDNTAVELTVTVTAPGGSGQTYPGTAMIPAGETSGVVKIKVPNVRRWWPIGYGDQLLYGVNVTAATQPTSARTASAHWTGRVGFRTVRVDTSDDAAGAGFTIYVNDERVLIRGVNWIPDHAFLTKVTPERYARGIADAVESGVNLIRVWGGGIYESDVLYDLADEAGILMWQDFLFACAAYSESPEMVAEVAAEARDNITRLSPHPSLIIWNGCNENIWATVDWSWSGPLAGRPWGDYYYHELLPNLLAELDPTRFYSPGSPYSFGAYRTPNDARYGTKHEWDVWNRTDYTNYRNESPRFVAEFGFQGPPAWSTLTKVVHDAPLDPFGHQMLVHQKANLGNQKLERGWQGHLPDPQNIKDWHWTTQLNQAAAVRFGIEHYRSHTPLNTGTILWQLNDNWPVVSWAAVDHDGHRKPLWYAMRAAHAPRLATLQPRPSQHAIDAAFEGLRPDDDVVALVLVNDTGEDFSGEFTAQRQTFDGQVLAEVQLPVDVPARGTARLDLLGDIVEFGDPAGEVVVVRPDAANTGFAPTFWNGAEVVGQKLDPEPLTVVATRAADGGVDLDVTANSYARDVFVMADLADERATVDNGMVTLAAGDQAKFHVTTSADVNPEAVAASIRTANDLLNPGGRVPGSAGCIETTGFDTDKGAKA